MKAYLLMICFLLTMIIGIHPSAALADGHETAGDVLQIALPVAAYAATYYLQDDDGRMQFYKSFATTLGTTYVLKYAVNAERPDGGNQSFPSGHTAAAFGGAAFVQMRYGWTYGLPSYLVASYVGWSRVHADRHYPRDVYAGAALALAANWYFVDRKQADDPQVSLWSDGQNIGLALNGRW